MWVSEGDSQDLSLGLRTEYLEGRDVDVGKGPCGVVPMRRIIAFLVYI